MAYDTPYVAYDTPQLSVTPNKVVILFFCFLTPRRTGVRTTSGIVSAGVRCQVSHLDTLFDISLRFGLRITASCSIELNLTLTILQNTIL